MKVLLVCNFLLVVINFKFNSGIFVLYKINFFIVLEGFLVLYLVINVLVICEFFDILFGSGDVLINSIFDIMNILLILFVFFI